MHEPLLDVQVVQSAHDLTEHAPRGLAWRDAAAHHFKEWPAGQSDVTNKSAAGMWMHANSSRICSGESTVQIASSWAMRCAALRSSPTLSRDDLDGHDGPG
jgi:hypothetical protein